MLIYIAHGDIYLSLWARIYQKGEIHPEGITAQLFWEARQLSLARCVKINADKLYDAVNPDQTNIQGAFRGRCM